MNNAILYFKDKINTFKDTYNPTDLMSKITSSAKKTGETGVYYVLLLYYALGNKAIPLKDRILVIAALGYYISPFDFIPDFVIAGLLDDMSILVYVVSRISSYIDDDVKMKARKKLDDWFGNHKAEKSGISVPESLELRDKKKEISHRINRSDMFAYISFDEISARISAGYGKNISFKRVSDKELRLTVIQKTIIKNINISANLKVENVVNETISIIYDGGFALDMIIPGVISLLLDKLPAIKAGVTTGTGHRIKIDLNKIEKAKKVMKVLSLQDIVIEENGLKIFATLR